MPPRRHSQHALPPTGAALALMTAECESISAPSGCRRSSPELPTTAQVANRSTPGRVALAMKRFTLRMVSPSYPYGGLFSMSLRVLSSAMKMGASSRLRVSATLFQPPPRSIAPAPASSTPAPGLDSAVTKVANAARSAWPRVRNAALAASMSAALIRHRAPEGELLARRGFCLSACELGCSRVLGAQLLLARDLPCCVFSSLTPCCSFSDGSTRSESRGCNLAGNPGPYCSFYTPAPAQEGNELCGEKEPAGKQHVGARCLRGGGTRAPRKAWAARAGGDIPVHQSAAGRDHGR